MLTKIILLEELICWDGLKWFYRNIL